jgi:hypothetical protein
VAFHCGDFAARGQRVRGKLQAHGAATLAALGVHNLALRRRRSWHMGAAVKRMRSWVLTRWGMETGGNILSMCQGDKDMR